MLPRVPKLCRRKAGGHVYCYVTDPATNQQVPMGRADDPATADNYEAWRREFLSRHREGTARVAARPGLTLAELVNAHDRWAEGYYRKRGKPTSELNNFRQTHRFLKPFFRVPARDFRPSQLKAMRQSMVGVGLARNHVNEQVNRVRRIVKWGVSNELVPVETLAALQTVAPLARGRTEAREEEPVRPVPLAVVEATLPRLRPKYQALVRFHLYSACRPSEAVCPRPCDIDRSRVPWVYVPHAQKMEHRGRRREILIGPKARAVIEPIMAECRPGDWLFPSRGRGRHSGLGPGHVTVNGYRQAITRVCAPEHAVAAKRGRKARAARPAVERWEPRQLRHTWLTHVRQLKGLRAAQQLAGHSEARTTEIYAEADRRLAAETAEELG